MKKRWLEKKTIFPKDSPLFSQSQIVCTFRKLLAKGAVKIFSSQMEHARKLYSLDPEKNSLSKCGVINYALPDVEVKCIYCPVTLLQLRR